jgi:hypothetical protein
MTRHTAGNKVSFLCPCGATEAGDPADRMVAGEATRQHNQTAKFSAYLKNASHSQVTLRVEKECECGLPYMTRSQVGPEATVIYTCTCGATRLS